MAIADIIKTDSENVVAFCRYFDDYDYGAVLQGVLVTPSTVEDRNVTVVFDNATLSYEQVSAIMGNFSYPCGKCIPSGVAIEGNYTAGDYTSFEIRETDDQVMYAVRVYRVATENELNVAGSSSPYRVENCIWETTWKAGACEAADLQTENYYIFTPPIIDASYFLAEVIHYGTEIIPRLLFNLFVSRQDTIARNAKNFIFYGSLEDDPKKEYDMRIYGSGASVADVTSDVYDFTSADLLTTLNKYTGIAMSNFAGGYLDASNPYMIMTFIVEDTTTDETFI
jgi:hypothetical protein